MTAPDLRFVSAPELREMVVELRAENRRLLEAARKRGALVRRLYDWWDVAAYPVMRMACIHLDKHSSWCRGRTYCRISHSPDARRGWR